MADTVSMARSERVRKAELNGDVACLRAGGRVLSQALMEGEVSQDLGAERHERTAERSGPRNGYRERAWATRVGTIGLRVPRVRDGSDFPTLLEPRKRSAQALVAVGRAAYVHGGATRTVDALVKALGRAGIATSQVSRWCEALAAEVGRFRGRPREGASPDVWWDATFVQARDAGRVVGTAVVIAIGVDGAGPREVVGLDVGPSEDGAFWLRFLRRLVARGHSGVPLVSSDAPQGLKGALAAVLHGARWPRGRVHGVRPRLALGPKSAAAMVAATVRTGFAQPDAVGAVLT